ncbi:ABC transporter substrate-binding protein [Lacrimispora sp.]|uniref:ABC transporter substrate-binding protein n=1 Tax=Lacrimispora sp. TaxID=2719234 RepID=UPI002FDA420A
MKNKIIASMLAAGLCLSLAACGQKTVNQTVSPESQQSAAESRQPVTSEPQQPSAPESKDKRTITDLGGNEVEIPAVPEIQRVVVISPPVMSFAVQTIPDTEMITGINSRAFTTSNVEIVNKVFPNWQSVDTSFIDASFAVNTESLLSLDPDIIFYYGNVQKQGLGNIDIPSVDFFSKGLNGPEAVSVAWDNQLREIFGLDTSGSLQEEWDRTNGKISQLLQNQNQEKTALCIFSNAAGSITVSGTDSFDAYAQSFFDMAGIQNAAADIEGTAEVSMEQIYQWNPDMIIVFHDAPAQKILDNSIEGQDWSLLKAWKDKAVYDVPRTTYSWITPCADSPVLPLWLVSKAYPDLISDSELKTEISEYYQRNYDITLTDDDINSILGYRKASGS